MPTKPKIPKSQKAATPQPRQVLALMESGDFRTCMYFNRFAVEKLDDHLLLHFGLIQNGDRLAHYNAVLEGSVIENSRENMLQFLGRIGDPEKKMLAWEAPRTVRQPEVTNFIQMAQAGDAGEIRLGMYSNGLASDIVRSGHLAEPKVQALPLALLRCDVEVMKHLLMAIFMLTP